MFANDLGQEYANFNKFYVLLRHKSTNSKTTDYKQQLSVKYGQESDGFGR